MAVLGSNDNPSSVGLRLRRVGNQVHDGFLDMDGRTGNAEQIVCKPGLDLYTGVKRHQFFELGRSEIVGYDPVQVTNLHIDHAPAGQRQKVLNDLRGAMTGLLNRGYRFLQGDFQRAGPAGSVPDSLRCRKGRC